MSLLGHHPEVARSLRALRYHRPGVVLRDAVGGALLNAGGASLHSRLPPSLQDIHVAGGQVHIDAARAARALCPPVDEDELEALCAEHDELSPDRWAIDRATSLFIYLVARMRRPATILETGVADGGSSFVWLSALRRNGGGRLHSVAVSDGVGSRVDDELRPHWHVHEVDAARPERELARLITEVGPLDVFFHDADPSYLAQRFEYETAWPAMVAGGLLAGEHVQESHAFLDFVADFDLRPHVLVAARKLIGAVVVR